MSARPGASTLHKHPRRSPYDPYHQWSASPPIYSTREVAAFFTLELVGFISCFAIVLTFALSKNIKRSPTCYNLLIVLGLACVFHCLTWFRYGPSASDHGVGGLVPTFGACLAQAAFVAGNSTAQPASGIALVFRVWVTTAALASERFAFLDRPWMDWALISLPWIAWLAYIPLVVVEGLKVPSDIKPSSVYCASWNNTVVQSHHYTSAVAAAVVILLELHLAYLIFTYYRAKRAEARQHLEHLETMSLPPGTPGMGSVRSPVMQQGQGRDGHGAGDGEGVERRDEEGQGLVGMGFSGQGGGAEEGSRVEEQETPTGEGIRGIEIAPERRERIGSAVRGEGSTPSTSIDPLRPRLFSIHRPSRQTSHQDSQGIYDATWRWSQLNLPLTLRVLAFGLYTLGATGVVIYIAVHKDSADTALPDLVNATLAPSCAIVFASQEDLLRAWLDAYFYTINLPKRLYQKLKRKAKPAQDTSSGGSTAATGETTIDEKYGGETPMGLLEALFSMEEETGEKRDDVIMPKLSYFQPHTSRRRDAAADDDIKGKVGSIT